MILGGVLFFFGLVVGSFLNSFLWRYQEKVTYKGRSMCPCCRHKINWYDNLPVISWFILSGKCRYCKKSISVQYPVVEIITGISFMMIGAFSEPGRVLNQAFIQITNGKSQITNQVLMSSMLMLLTLLFITAVMIMISIYDYKTKEIPNGFNATFVAGCLVYALTASYLTADFINHFSILFLTSALAFLFFYSFVYFSKETWMGGGDAKFAIGMGLLLGPAGTFLAIMTASIVGSIYGIFGITMAKFKINHLNLNQNSKFKINNFSSEIPFGPFLALGTFFVVCFGPQIIDYYVKIVLGI